MSIDEKNEIIKNRKSLLLDLLLFYFFYFQILSLLKEHPLKENMEILLQLII